MIILLSPAKKLDENVSDIKSYSFPLFFDEACSLINELKTYSSARLQSLMGVSQKIADLNVERYNSFVCDKKFKVGKQALYMFNGDVYNNMVRGGYIKNDLEFAQEHLLILSGLYGALRPLDRIQPYRLEMGTSLKYNGAKNLYELWSEKVSNYIKKEIKKHNSPFILNLASKEYSKVIDRDTVGVPVIEVQFKQNKNGQYKSFGLLAKRARGMMADFAIKNKIDDINGIKKFKTAGYSFQQSLSLENNLIFHQD